MIYERFEISPQVAPIERRDIDEFPALGHIFDKVNGMRHELATLLARPR